MPSFYFLLLFFSLFGISLGRIRVPNDDPAQSPPGMTKSHHPSLKEQHCDDPLSAVLETFDCWHQEDASCVLNHTDTVNFRKFHNGQELSVSNLANPRYLSMSFLFSDFDFDVVEVSVVPGTNNQVHIHYLETVTLTDGTDDGMRRPPQRYPFGFSITQNEVAIVTVNSECQAILWNQTGSDAEQRAVNRAVFCMLANPRVWPFLLLLPFRTGSH